MGRYNQKKNMKFSTASTSFIFALLSGNAAAFSAFGAKKASAAAVKPVDPFDTPEDLPGVLSPAGFFDPLGFAAKADNKTLRRYREAELTHGRVSMLAVLGFLVGEKVEGSSFLFDAQISGPAITHLGQ